MPLYSLIASGRSDVQVSEIVLSRDANGEVEHRVAVGEATEIPEELVPEARSLAARIGSRLLEMEDPEEGKSTSNQMDEDAKEKASSETDEPDTSETPSEAPSQEDQPVGVDVVGESPPVSAGGAESPSAPQQGQQPNPDASTFSTPPST